MSFYSDCVVLLVLDEVLLHLSSFTKRRIKVVEALLFQYIIKLVILILLKNVVNIWHNTKRVIKTSKICPRTIFFKIVNTLRLSSSSPSVLRGTLHFYQVYQKNQHGSSAIITRNLNQTLISRLIYKFQTRHTLHYQIY